jgi:phage replication-related protein YjqB (UPF0714/DUF867 family)
MAYWRWALFNVNMGTTRRATAASVDMRMSHPGFRELLNIKDKI